MNQFYFRNLQLYTSPCVFQAPFERDVQYEDIPAKKKKRRYQMFQFCFVFGLNNILFGNRNTYTKIYIVL